MQRVREGSEEGWEVVLRDEDVGSWKVSCVPEGSGIFWQEHE